MDHPDLIRVEEALNGILLGKPTAVRLSLVCLLANGHLLIEDRPGVGKTTLAHALGQVLGLDYRRIQFTSDLLPGDVLGVSVFEQSRSRFEFHPGPIFTQVLLADEINRAPPKTQSALLEAMEEGQVTVAGETRPLPQPFFVIATQNPVEQEGTFPLPEAQVDRFLVKTSMGYPDESGEVELLERRAARDSLSPTVDRVFEPERVEALRAVPETVLVDDDLLTYIVDICRRTRVDGRVAVGVSPRGTQRLFEAARAYAVLQGREFVTPDDIKRVAQPSLAHRLVLTPDATVNDVDKADIIDDVLETVSVPTIE